MHRALRRPCSLQAPAPALAKEGFSLALTSPRKAAHSTTVVNQRSTSWARPFRAEATASDSFSVPGEAERSRRPPASRNSSSNSSVAASNSSYPPSSVHRSLSLQGVVRPRPGAPESPRAPTPAGTSPRELDPGTKPSHRAGAVPGPRPLDRRAPARTTFRK